MSLSLKIKITGSGGGTQEDNVKTFRFTPNQS
jgi:hypothetical protein